MGNKMKYIAGTLGVQSLLVIGILVFGFLLVRRTYVRWDLTEDQRFTISEASRDLAKGLEDPLTIRCYFTEVPPRYEPLQRQVFDVLEEYRAASGGKITVERFDPNETKAAQNEAKNYGIQPVRLPVYGAASVQVLMSYGGIVLVYRDKKSEVINIAQRYPAGYEGLSVLEYELSSRMWQLSNERPTLGICGNLMSQPAPNPMSPQGSQPQPEFTSLRRVLGEAFELKDVDLKQEEPDPKSMPLLLVVRPKEFSDVEVFRLDQYMMKGGRVAMFVTQGAISQSPWERRFAYKPFATGLDAWLEFQGVRVPNEFVMHARNANVIQKQVDLGGIPAMTQVPNHFWPIFSAEEALNSSNPAVSTLDTVELFWPHPVDILEDRVASGVEASALVSAHSGESWRWKNLQKVDVRGFTRADYPTPSDLRESNVAVALAGKLKSYFAGKPVPPSLLKAKSEGAEGEEDKKDEPEAPKVVEQMAEPGFLVVLGNAIFISDAILGKEVTDQTKARSLLAFNLVDWLARSAELINIRKKQFAKRRLVDKDFEAAKEDVEAESASLQEKGPAGVTADDVEKLQTAYDTAVEKRKERRNRTRWLNIIVPCFIVLVAGIGVWILRAALRAKGRRPATTSAYVAPSEPTSTPEEQA